MRSGVKLQRTWPAKALVLVDALQAGGSILAGVRSTFRNVLFTVVAYKSSPLTVTNIAVKKRTQRKSYNMTANKSSNEKCQILHEI